MVKNTPKGTEIIRYGVPNDVAGVFDSGESGLIDWIRNLTIVASCGELLSYGKPLESDWEEDEYDVLVLQSVRKKCRMLAQDCLTLLSQEIQSDKGKTVKVPQLPHIQIGALTSEEKKRPRKDIDLEQFAKRLDELPYVSLRKVSEGVWREVCEIDPHVRTLLRNSQDVTNQEELMSKQFFDLIRMLWIRTEGRWKDKRQRKISVSSEELTAQIVTWLRTDR